MLHWEGARVGTTASRLDWIKVLAICSFGAYSLALDILYPSEAGGTWCPSPRLLEGPYNGYCWFRAAELSFFLLRASRIPSGELFLCLVEQKCGYQASHLRGILGNSLSNPGEFSFKPWHSQAVAYNINSVNWNFSSKAWKLAKWEEWLESLCRQQPCAVGGRELSRSYLHTFCSCPFSGGYKPGSPVPSTLWDSPNAFYKFSFCFCWSELHSVVCNHSALNEKSPFTGPLALETLQIFLQIAITSITNPNLRFCNVSL